MMKYFEDVFMRFDTRTSQTTADRQTDVPLQHSGRAMNSVA